MSNWKYRVIITAGVITLFTIVVMMNQAPYQYLHITKTGQKFTPTQAKPAIRTETNQACNITDLPCMAERVATRTPAGPRPVITLAILDDTYVEMFLNFAESARMCNVTNLLPVTLGEHANKLLREHGYLAFLETSLDSISGKEASFGSPEFKKKGAMKFIMTHRLVSLGYTVLLLDLDNVFVKNPFPFFKCKECDIEIQIDKPWNKNDLCVGIVLFRATEQTQELLGRSVEIMRNDPKKWDQGVLNNELKKAQKENTIKYQTLPFDQFPTGFQIQRKTVNIHAFNVNKSVIFHNNWSFRYRMKKYRFRELGLWFLDENQYYSSTTRKYFTYDNCIPNFGANESSALDTAFKISAILKRTLILPVMHCGTTGTKACALDHVVDIVKWDTAHENKYREHSFLKNPRVPVSVREAVSIPIVVSTDKLRTEKLDLEGAYYIFNPKNSMVGPTADELRNLNKVFKDFSVIKFHSLYFRIAR